MYQMFNSKTNLVDYYFKRLDYWKKELKLKGYTQEVFKLAQKDVKLLDKEKK